MPTALAGIETTSGANSPLLFEEAHANRIPNHRVTETQSGHASHAAALRRRRSRRRAETQAPGLMNTLVFPPVFVSGIAAGICRPPCDALVPAACALDLRASEPLW
jgi:hypothetical protein